MPLDPSEFRRILGHWVTGVAVVAARSPDGMPCGLTVNAVTSLSLEPPLVLTCIDRAADSHDCIARAAAFSVNVLAQDQEALARRFAGTDAADKFRGVAYRNEVTGAPVLEDALAWVDCRLHTSYPGGDHTIFIGEVLAGAAGTDQALAYYRGGYGRFVP